MQQRCDNEEETMRIKTIFYSYSGITRGIAQKIQEACGGELVDVKALKPYSKITAYSLGCYRAMKGECDDSEPASIDVSESDIIVIGTPVWAFRAVPPINAALEALTGCEGKTAVLFATCGAQAKETLPHLAEQLAAKDVTIAGEFVFDKNSVQDKDKTDALIAAVKSAGGSE
jgi:flavodoxin